VTFAPRDTMTAVEYQRPSWPEMVFHDADGNAIPYGTRWPDGTPAEDSYSRITNPQRHAPLIDITHALIAHLDSEYRVGRTTDGNVTVLDPGLTAASLRFDIDPIAYFVRVTAGPVAQFVFPSCACDSCDETVEPVADDLETTVFAVVAGHLRQRIDRPRHPLWAPQHSPGTQRRGLVIELGGEHGSSSWSLLGRTQRRRIQELLRGTPDHWEPWPRRT
jgi:hypothetical protein